MSIEDWQRAAGGSRRSFLLTLAAGAAGGVLYINGRHWFASGEPVNRQWSDWLLDADNRDAVIRLGKAYRAAHPAERDTEVLADKIGKALAAVEAETPADPAAAGSAAALQRRLRDEYARDEVVQVTGWVLSITEARLYALVASETAES